MKKLAALLLLAALLATALPSLAEPAFSGNTQLMYDAIRWNLNLPKQSMLVSALEYLCKMGPDVQVHTLLMEVTTTTELEMQYGTAAKIILIDLDTGDIIDYTNFDGSVMWPDGELTDKNTALHLLFNSYWSYLEGYNSNIASDYEIISPISEADIAAINAALSEVFIR